MDDTARLEVLRQQSGVEPSRCCQCGKCTAGCPMARAMDINPRRLMRHMQMGLIAPLLRSRAPWLCLCCHICASRCPQAVPLVDLMQALRRMAAGENIYPLRRARLFSRAFLAPLKLFGRSHELTMTAYYNIASGRLLQHFAYLPGMLKGRKLLLIPQRVRDRRVVQKMFKEGRP